MLDPIHLASLVGSRICHDLLSPIGAIGNGVELMMMDASGTSSQETALILESTANANARIRYFRVAFGLCGPDQRIGRSEVASILADGAAGGRLNIAWDSPQDLARRDVKLAYLGLMCLETALIHGGDVRVAVGDQGWSLSARAPRIKIDAALWDGLARGAKPDHYSDITAGHVNFLLMALEAVRQHRSINVVVAHADETHSGDTYSGENHTGGTLTISF